MADVKEYLWLITGREPVLFQIPVRIKDYGAEAEVSPAIPLLKIQLSALAASLIAFATRDGEASWRIETPDLKKVGDKCAYDCDPELLLVWERARIDPRRQNMSLSAVERDEFIDALHLKGIGNSPEELHFYWSQFKKHIADWLINKERPVNIGVAKLHNSVYRADWQQIVAWDSFEYFNSKISSMQGSFKLIRSGSFLNSAFTSLDVMAFDSQYGICVRRIEVEQTPEWITVTTQAEREKLKRVGKHAYIRYTSHSVRRGIVASRALYEKWLSSVGLPSPACADDLESGRLQFVAHTQNRLAYFQVYQWRQISDLVFRQFPSLRCRDDRALPQADGGLSKVPNVEPNTQDMREPNG